MARHTRSSARRRAATHAHDEPEDKFIAQVLEWSTWAKRHSQTLILATVVLVVLVAAAVYYVRQRGAVGRQASIELESIQELILLDEREGAAQELTSYIQRFGDSPHAAEARLLLGQLHLEGGNPEEAIPILQDAAGNMREPIAIQAAILLAAAYEENGQLDLAEDVYLGVADRATMSFERRDALADAARLRKYRGDLPGAAALYQRILDDIDPDHPLRGLFELRLAEVQAAISS
jgi:predicted negative regulator of RcsB-dependent stress response